jgi:hypothetical protein
MTSYCWSFAAILVCSILHTSIAAEGFLRRRFISHQDTKARSFLITDYADFTDFLATKTPRHKVFYLYFIFLSVFVPSWLCFFSLPCRKNIAIIAYDCIEEQQWKQCY